MICNICSDFEKKIQIAKQDSLAWELLQLMKALDTHVSADHLIRWKNLKSEDLSLLSDVLIKMQEFENVGRNNDYGLVAYEFIELRLSPFASSGTIHYTLGSKIPHEVQFLNLSEALQHVEKAIIAFKDELAASAAYMKILPEDI